MIIYNSFNGCIRDIFLNLLICNLTNVETFIRDSRSLSLAFLSRFCIGRLTRHTGFISFTSFINRTVHIIQKIFIHSVSRRFNKDRIYLVINIDILHIEEIFCDLIVTRITRHNLNLLMTSTNALTAKLVDITEYTIRCFKRRSKSPLLT